MEIQKAQLLAMTHINATQMFLTQLLGFVNTMYDKLLFIFSKFTAEQAWAVTTQILDRICEDLFAPKEGVAAVMTIEDPVSICAHMLGSCFKAHNVMALYMEHNFENHTAILVEYIKVPATNSGFEKVERLEASVTEMKVNVQKAVVESGKARSIADGVSSQVGVIIKNVEAAGKRVTKLEDKVFKLWNWESEEEVAWMEKDKSSISKIAPTLSVKKVTEVEKPPNSPGSVKYVDPDKGYKRFKVMQKGTPRS